MRIVFFDTETALIQPGRAAPPMTCMSYGDEARGVGDVVDRFKAHDMMRDWLRDPEVKLVAHNTAFDTVVMCAEFPDLLPLFFAAYEAGRIEDTMLREQLIDIAEGHFRWETDPLTDEVIKRKSYALGSLVSGLEKGTFQLRYGPLRDVPVERWEPGFYKYALQDAAAALHLYRSQERRHGVVVDSEAQARAGFVLQLMSVWGMRTDPERTAWLEKALEQNVRSLASELIGHGLIRDSGSRDMRAIRQRLADAGITLAYTPTGQIATGSDNLRAAADSLNDEALNMLVTYAEQLKLLTTYVPALKQGTIVPINARFNTLVETGRTSCSKPNLQNLPRGKHKDDLAHHVRECFVPRDGFYFNSVDYDSLEVRTFGQVLYETVGGTTLRDAYQKDPDFDPHSSFAARELGISYEEAIERKNRRPKDVEMHDRRQMMKAFVFGKPGGMGDAKMVTFAKKSYGVDLTLARSRELGQRYVQWLPEVRAYWDRIGNAAEHGPVCIAQLRSGRVRGGMRYTDCCNGWFQALAADGAKAALWEVSKRCYLDRSSPLYGSRPVCFVHDEIITEVPKGIAHEAATEQERVMCETMMRYTPDVPSRASPALMERWYKGADAVYENGRLVPWRPRT